MSFVLYFFHYFFHQGIIARELKLNDFIIKGNWTITALYGHQVMSISLKLLSLAVSGRICAEYEPSSTT